MTDFNRLHEIEIENCDYSLTAFRRSRPHSHCADSFSTNAVNWCWLHSLSCSRCHRQAGRQTGRPVSHLFSQQFNWYADFIKLLNTSSTRTHRARGLFAHSHFHWLFFHDVYLLIVWACMLEERRKRKKSTESLC